MTLPKEIKYGAEARAQVLDGANALANAVKSTLGPRGRNVMIDKGPFQMPRITKDGVTVAREITFKDKFKNMGAQTLREVASKACDKAGDGTTSATVLAQAIFNEGAKVVAAGLNPIDVQRGIALAVNEAVKFIKEKARPVDTKEEWAQVATLSANSDREIGERIAEALSHVGKEGVVVVEEGKSLDYELDVVEGMKFDRGFVSPYFANQAERPVCEFNDPIILVFNNKLSSISPIIPLLEMANQQKKPLLIIADDIEGEALHMLVINKMRADFRVCAVRAPGYGERKKEYLDDIAVLTGAQFITEELGMSAQVATSNAFGRAKKVVITANDTTIVGGMGDADKIESRCANIRSMIDEATSDYLKDMLKERMAKINGKVAVLKIGGATEIEVKERKDRIDDALHATRAAVEEGIVPGGGACLLYAARAIAGLKGANADQDAGIVIARKAMEAPAKQIADNAGVDGVVVAGKLRDHDASDTDFGFDGANLDYGNLVERGIIDPAKVVRVSLQDAASVAGLLITTDVLIAEAPQEEKK